MLYDSYLCKGEPFMVVQRDRTYNDYRSYSAGSGSWNAVTFSAGLAAEGLKAPEHQTKLNVKEFQFPDLPTAPPDAPDPPRG